MMTRFYTEGLSGVNVFIEGLVDRFKPKVNLRPELGIPRTHVEDAILMKLAHEALDLGLFKSIDLYSHQEACPAEAVKTLYVKARENGMFTTWSLLTGR